MITTLNAMVRDDPRAKGIDPQTLRRDGDLALLSRVRAGDATLPFAGSDKRVHDTVFVTIRQSTLR